VNDAVGRTAASSVISNAYGRPPMRTSSRSVDGRCVMSRARAKAASKASRIAARLSISDDRSGTVTPAVGQLGPAEVHKRCAREAATEHRDALGGLAGQQQERRGELTLRGGRLARPAREPSEVQTGQTGRGFQVDARPPLP